MIATAPSASLFQARSAGRKFDYEDVPQVCSLRDGMRDDGSFGSL